MAAVTLVKAGEPAKTVTSPTDFVNLIYGQGYLPQAGGVAQAWQTLDADAPVPPAAPRPVTMADVQDQSSDFSLAQRAAFVSLNDEGQLVIVVDGEETVVAAGGIGGGGLTEEQVRDLVGTLLVEGNGIDVLVDDAGNIVSISVPDASTTTKGIVELATAGEATTGTDTARAVTPAGLKAALDARPASGLTGVTIALDTDGVPYFTPTT